MKDYIYKEIGNDTVVDSSEAEDYALTELGLKKNDELVIIPKGKNGDVTLDQLAFIEQTVEWFFSGNWIKEEKKEEATTEMQRQAELEDKIYEDNLNKEDF